MRMAPYLSFNGDCEEAFAFYAACLGGQVGEMFRYTGSPMADQVPVEWGDKIMHGSVRIGGQELMGADVTDYQKPQGFSLSLHIEEVADGERIFEALGRGGEVVMPLAETFWAARFGMIVDRFGMPWTINCGGAGEAAAG